MTTIEAHIEHDKELLDDPQLNPINRWRSHAHLLYGNWINEIYQTTPFDIQKIGLKQA